MQTKQVINGKALGEAIACERVELGLINALVDRFALKFAELAVTVGKLERQVG